MTIHEQVIVYENLIRDHVCVEWDVYTMNPQTTVPGNLFAPCCIDSCNRETAGKHRLSLANSSQLHIIGAKKILATEH